MLYLSSKKLFPLKPANTRRYSLDAEEWNRGFPGKDKRGEDHFRQRKKQV